MIFKVHVKKKIKECDAAPAADPCGGMSPIGMGDAVPVGGPDRWDNILGSVPSKKRKTRYKTKRSR